MKIITIPSETTPSAPQPAKAHGNVLAALKRAANATGADFGYLLRTAMRESNLNPGAQAATSSATGLFQFIEQTWLGTVKNHGAAHGLQAYADAIEMGSNGRYEVADAGLRREILALRKDPAAAALMAGEMTNQMRSDMEAALGRGVSAGELYVAHFLGPKGATKLIKAAEANPNASAAAIFPDAAAANRSIFYTKGGEARSAADVMAVLTSKHQGATPSAGENELFADVPQPRDDLGAVGALANVWRSAASATLPPSRITQPISVMAPVMAQLLAALDPLPHLATTLFANEPELRRSETDPLL